MAFKEFLLKFKSSDRGQSRLFKAGLTGVSGLAFRFLGMAIGLISVPLTAKYLGAERYGLWLTLSTFLGWGGMADFGLVNSLRNTLATADGQEDREKARIAVSSALGISICVAGVVATVFLLAYPFINWSRVFNVSSPLAVSDASSAILVILLIFVVHLVIATPLEVYSAYQEGYLANLWTGASNIASIIALIIAVSQNADLPLLVAAVFGVPLLGSVLSGIYLFYWRRPWLRPSIAYFRWNEAFSLLKVGSQFWFAQIAAIVLLQTDLIVVAQLFGAAEVAKYGISLKLFSLISAIQMSFVIPLWAAYAEAFARQDFSWIIKTFKRSFLLTLIWTTATSGFLVVFGQSIVLFLVAKDVVPSKALLLAMSATVIVSGIAQTVAILMNGLGEVRLQALMGPPLSLLNLVVSIVLGRLIGPAGVSLGTASAIIPTLLIYKKYLDRKISVFEPKNDNCIH
jgi:O-antigen/teichoic acid export membrane protein